MKNCKRFQKMVSDYIEGVLGNTNKKYFEEHLDDCRNCHAVVTRIRSLRENLSKLAIIKTSSDFDTVLRTRIKIESGIGRRRLQEIVWSWPAKIPVYGMSVALIIIAFVLVLEQTQKPYQSRKPEPYINNQWYGGNPQENSVLPIFEETENVIFIIDRMPPEKLSTNNGNIINSSYTDSITKVETGDSLKLQKSKIEQANQVIY